VSLFGFGGGVGGAVAAAAADAQVAVLGGRRRGLAVRRRPPALEQVPRAVPRLVARVPPVGDELVRDSWMARTVLLVVLRQQEMRSVKTNPCFRSLPISGMNKVK